MILSIPLLKQNQEVELSINFRCAVIVDLIKHKSLLYNKKLREEIAPYSHVCNYYFHPLEDQKCYLDHYDINLEDNTISITSNAPYEFNEFHSETFNIKILLINIEELNKYIDEFMDLRYAVALNNIKQEIEKAKKLEDKELAEYNRLKEKYGDKS